jgi:hypothetical protein
MTIQDYGPDTTISSIVSDHERKIEELEKRVQEMEKQWGWLMREDAEKEDREDESL